MARTEWLRTFVCVCQAGSVTEAARRRNLSQPAATAHVRLLETAAGTTLFVRRRDGVVPTEAGRRLYAEVADPLDRLSGVLAGLDGGSVAIPRPALRVGASPEVFTGLVIEHLDALGVAVHALFGTDDDLHRSLVHDETDLVVTAAPISRRGFDTAVVGHHHYALVAPTEGVLNGVRSFDELAARLRATPWVSFSSDLPKTRRFWKQHVGRAFDAEVRLVAPDLRVVLGAVEAGVGASLLPTMVCAAALRRRSVAEVFPVGPLVEPRPLWATVRSLGDDRPEVAELFGRLERAGGEAT